MGREKRREGKRREGKGGNADQVRKRARKQTVADSFIVKKCTDTLIDSVGNHSLTRGREENREKLQLHLRQSCGFTQANVWARTYTHTL